METMAQTRKSNVKTIKEFKERNKKMKWLAKTIWFLIYCLLICIFIQPLFAEVYTTAKIGYVEMNADNARVGIIKEVAVGYEWEKFSAEVSFGHWRMHIKGNAADKLPYKYVGEMIIMPLMGSVRYEVLDFLYIGGGYGTAFINFRENYSGKAKIDSSGLASAIAGLKLGNWFLEYRRLFGDLNIESGNSGIGVLEDYSRLDGSQIMIGYKLKW